jgi:hypothetical protein
MRKRIFLVLRCSKPKDNARLKLDPDCSAVGRKNRGNASDLYVSAEALSSFSMHILTLDP